MKTPTGTTLDPEIGDFLTRVRAELADLPSDVAEELTDGLESDLAERVSDDGGGRPLGELLGDPEDYAAELRAAAGLPSSGRSRGGAPGRAALGVHRLLDSGHESYVRVLDAVPGRPRAFVESLRPAWWLVRGWAAWALALELFRTQIAYTSHTLLALVPICLVSVQVGRGSWGLDRLRRLASGRVLLASLNLLALLVAPSMVDDSVWAVSRAMAYQFQDSPADQVGLVNDGVRVCNVFPYDAQGRPISGVQLLDQRGRPVTAQCPGAGRQGLWSNGFERLGNVFPYREGGPGRSWQPAQRPERELGGVIPPR